MFLYLSVCFFFKFYYLSFPAITFYFVLFDYMYLNSISRKTYQDEDFMPRKKKHKTGKTPPAAGAGGGVGKAGPAAKGPGGGATFCAQCNVTFTRPSNLKKHNLIKHTKVSYLFFYL